MSFLIIEGREGEDKSFKRKAKEEQSS